MCGLTCAGSSLWCAVLAAAVVACAGLGVSWSIMALKIKLLSSFTALYVQWLTAGWAGQPVAADQSAAPSGLCCHCRTPRTYSACL
jgi:hypothetical protein